MKILLIDNGTKLLKKLEVLIPGVEVVKKFGNINPWDTDEYDLIVLSGSVGFSVLYNHNKFQKEINLIKSSTKPIIGMCFGCELVAYAFGGELKELSYRDKGIREIHIIDRKLFKKKTIKVYEGHRWVVSKLPPHFKVIAKSDEGIEAIKHETLPIYGFQFHPENFVDEAEGDELFLQLLSSFKKSSIMN